MEINYYEFSKVMVFFNLGAVISNIISSYVLKFFNNRHIIVCVSFIEQLLVYTILDVFRRVII